MRDSTEMPPKPRILLRAQCEQICAEGRYTVTVLDKGQLRHWNKTRWMEGYYPDWAEVHTLVDTPEEALALIQAPSAERVR